MVTNHTNRASILVPQDITFNESDEFKRQLASAIDRPCDCVILNCSELNQITSSHIGLLWYAYSACDKKDIKACLTGISLGLSRILNALDLEQFFAFERRDNAITSSETHSCDTQAGESFVMNVDPTFESADASLVRFGQYLKDINVPDLVAIDLNTTYYEIARNIVEHAKVPSESQIRFSVVLDARHMTMKFIDDGEYFDPTTLKIGDALFTHLRLKEHRGLGLMMIQRLTDEMVYERRQKQNILTIEKHWGGSS